MPAYNAGNYILDAVESIINQSYQNWELIIINDGSTDDTQDKLKTLSDHRIRVHNKTNEGQCAAANAAYRYSNGQLIKFVDADDLLSADFLLEQVNALNGCTDCIAYGQWGRFYQDDLSTFRIEKRLIKGNMQPFDWLVASMRSSEVMLQCALWLIPRTILDKAGLWNEKLSLINDFEFFIRVLLHASELRYSEGAVLWYRSGLINSLSSTYTAKGALSAYQSTELGVAHLLAYRDTPEIRTIAADCFQRFVYTFYPEHYDLVKKAEGKVKELGGSSIEFPAGGYTRMLSRFCGWKNTKKIKSLFKKR